MTPSFPKNSPKALALIPARSGSKGLPDKNILTLAGTPLLVRAIEMALDSGLYATVHLSTDSAAYADLGKAAGADVPWLRPASLSGDTASTWDVVRDALARYEAQGQTFDLVTVLQPTSPLRTVEDLQTSLNLLIEHDYEAVISVCEMDHSPLWANTLPEDGSLKNFIQEEALQARQKLPTYYRLNGAIYHVRTGLLDKKVNLVDHAHAYIMPRKRSIDIDTELDFRIAELYLENER